MNRRKLCLLFLGTTLLAACQGGKQLSVGNTGDLNYQTDETMENKDFSTTLLVDQSPEQVFKAVTNVRGWWSEEIEGGTADLNDEFLYHYKDVHRVRMRLTEVVPEQKVVWLVLNNHFSFTKDKTEWEGTRISFEIQKKGDKTELRFTHQGLTPAYECYNVCRDGWSNYINNSLYKLITTGKGEPNRREGGFNSELAKKWNIEQ